MAKATFDGIEIEQKLLESLDIADHFNFGDGKYENLPLYEKREKVTQELYKKYPHILVTKNDEMYGLERDEYRFIKKVQGLYKQIENAGKI